MSKLTEDQISVFLRSLPKWQVKHNVLTKTITLAKFMDSIDFINQIADLAEIADHHPDLLIEYNKVTISLTTHNKNGITGKDFSLAEQIEKLHSRMQSLG